MAEITYNDLLGQLSGMEKDQFEGVFGSSGFLDNYQNNPNSLSVTGHDNFNKFEPIAKAYQASETIPKGNFVSNMFNFGSADAAIPDKTYGLQDSMMGMSINPDGSLNYNNTQPQNLGFRSMVDMANDANNFDSQFNNTPMQMSPTGPFNFQTRSAPQIASPRTVIDPNRIPGRIQEAVEPQQYRIRDQLARDFLQGGILKDARKSLEETFGPIGNKIGSGLGSLKDFAMNKGTQGFNLAKQLPGMALSAMTGIPGIGMILGALGNMGSNEYAQATTANMQKQNNNLQSLGLDGVSNFGGVTTDDLGRITNNGLNYNTPEGIMSGYNSGFDLASAALGRIGTIQNAIEKGRYKDKFAIDRANKKIDNLKTAAVASAQAKRQAYQDKIDRAKNEAAANRARAKSITAGYGGHDNSPGATGPTAAGAGMGVGGGYASDYGFLKDGGSVGLASMFTRRR